MSSDADVVLRIKNVSKVFEMYDKPIHRLWQTLFMGRKNFYRPFRALDDVTFEVRRGECVGIIGRNGAGKSTLLQIITGTLGASSGDVEVHGRVAALLELGSGFNPDFTGRENVYMNAAILGLTRAETEAKLPEIIAFADIGDFIDQPIKTYSSGMLVRLAFAVVAHVDADVLIIDEALAVGDAFFCRKCMKFLRDFMQNNTVLFVSHDTGTVVNLCNRAVMLQSGRVVCEGDPQMVTDRYLAEYYESFQGASAVAAADKVSVAAADGDYRDMRQDFINGSNLRNDIELLRFKPDSPGFGKGGAVIEEASLCDMEGRRLNWIVGGELVRLRVVCRGVNDIFSPLIGFLVRDKQGREIFGDNTCIAYMDKPLRVKSGERFAGEFDFRMPILPAGDYSMEISAAEGTQTEHIQHQWLFHAINFKSHADSCCHGLAGIPALRISLEIME